MDIRKKKKIQFDKTSYELSSFIVMKLQIIHLWNVKNRTKNNNNLTNNNNNNQNQKLNSKQTNDDGKKK